MQTWQGLDYKEKFKSVNKNFLTWLLIGWWLWQKLRQYNMASDWLVAVPGVNTERPELNGCLFVDSIFKYIFLNNSYKTLDKISLEDLLEKVQLIGPLVNVVILKV